MNERIRELAEQAGLEFDDDMALESEPIYYTSQKDLEKFAELIVKESLSALNGMHLWQSVNNQNYPASWHDAVDQSIDTIKEHFGVEE